MQHILIMIGIIAVFVGGIKALATYDELKDIKARATKLQLGKEMKQEDGTTKFTFYKEQPMTWYFGE